MKPKKYTAAHKTNNLGELVCSNSLKTTSIDKASGILKNEMGNLFKVMLIKNSSNNSQTGF